MSEHDEDLPESIEDLPESIEIPIDGTLDLHHFSPREIKDLIPDYLAECRAAGILEVRLIHGKGTGALRRGVEGVLTGLPYVKSSRGAQQVQGGWGATIVELERS
ncbi:MAG: DNA mismatch repair protein MutS [Proteobacteria bacterium]|nr:MAG: DNA mismatch repair protein MutS [Pseudomonadota bacterium]PIE19923.1 MAG: DNA mismatch repair protein MutS [Pseudomonadota bacterium]